MQRRSADFTNTFRLITAGRLLAHSTEADPELDAWHRRHGTIVLTPRAPDEFTTSAWFVGEVRFEREDGAVTGAGFKRFRPLYKRRRPNDEIGETGSRFELRTRSNDLVIDSLAPAPVRPDHAVGAPVRQARPSQRPPARDYAVPPPHP